jgi:broad specificity phosphatase PhoE
MGRAEQLSRATTTIHVVRHAKAADRARWTGDDAHRPLTRGGQRQAASLGKRLRDDVGPAATVIGSSPAIRCRETLDPLAQHLGVSIASLGQLAEGSSHLDALAAMRALGTPRSAGGGAGARTRSLTRHIVACTHGDVMWGLLDEFEPLGLLLPYPSSAPKACTLEIDFSGETVVALRYVPPPSSDA